MLVVRFRTAPLGRETPIWLALLLGTVGCTPPAPPPTPPPPTPVSTTDDELRQEVDHVLDFTLQQRRLNTVEHGAWQILHGVLAYQDKFPVQVGVRGPLQSALAYLTAGGEIQGWTFQPGDILDPATGRRGVRAVVEPGTRKGQGHADQWLALLAQANLPREYTVRLGGQTYTIDQYVQQVQRDVPHNVLQEWSWTLIGLTHYLSTDAQWTAADGQTWSIERLLQSEIEQDIDESACGGSHRLIGVATTVRRRQAEGGKIEGVWQQANQVVQQAIQRTLEFQNPDGSFSSQYFRRPANSPDMAIVLGTTGHLLEFLTVAMNDDQLDQPQVRLAVRHLCGLFRDTRDLPLECGALYHAAHGLVLFRQRSMGPREYHWESPADGSAAEDSPAGNSATVEVSPAASRSGRAPVVVSPGRSPRPAVSSWR
jgi:hypothetical protein